LEENIALRDTVEVVYLEPKVQVGSL